jgi:soluble lytic murein transglycosylase-like protein
VRILGDEKPIEIDLNALLKNAQRHKILTVIVLLCFFVIVAGMICGGYFFTKEIVEIKDTQKIQYVEHQETNQFLLSTIDWSVMRTKKILYMRDMIVDEWKRTKVSVRRDEAYLIAETILKECESYTYIDPLLVLSLQRVESGFRKDLVSEMGAIGLNQIMPMTGRLLCGYYGISYDDSLLYNVELSTKFSVKLLDFAYSTYHSWEAVLADYNGGPWQVYYYRKERDRLSPETKEFIPNVTAFWRNYKDNFKGYKVDTVLLSR